MMDDRLSRRFRQAQDAMREHALDFLFIVNRENLIYFTGLVQFECMAVIIPREGEPCAVTLWLDKKYVEEHTGVKTYGYYFPRENLVSKAVERIKSYGVPNPRLGFERYFVDFAVYDGLRQSFAEKNFVNASELLYRLRAVKDAEEINKIKQAAAAVSCGMSAAVKAVRPGVAELDILAEAEYAMLKAGSGGVPFRPQVVSGERALLTHPCASGKKIQNEEIVVIHLGATCDGYTAKMCRTVAVGEISPQQAQVYDLLCEAQTAAVSALKPGATAGQVDLAAREIIRKAGYEAYYLDQVGYGVGLRQSEFYPVIGKDRPDRIEAGMVVDLLLPTIYYPGIGGPRITDVLYVGDSGAQFLTNYPRELVII